MTALDPVPRSTGRVTLRRLCTDDLRAFQAYRLDPIVGQYQGWSPMSDAQALSFLNEMNVAAALAPGEWFQIGIADRQSNTLIGDIGIRISGDGLEAEIGFTLGRRHQGQGLAREAVGEVVALVFEVTDVQRIVAVTDARNDSASKLLSMLGMARIGKQEAIFRGAPCVEDTFALARGAWRGNRGERQP
jgi:RimJ/RimL family protein N-acetyltransferase